jgi:hypothetical protein
MHEMYKADAAGITSVESTIFLRIIYSKIITIKSII